MSFPTKKLLIAGGGYADIPQIQAAKSLGFYVITSGNRAEDLGHQYSDECCLADFSNHDAMLNLAISLRVDAVCASCNDFSALSVAYVAEKLGLPGHDSLHISRIIHHKDLYREFAQQHFIPSPIAIGFDSPDLAISGLDAFKYPVIVKPVDLTGGKGISKAYTEDEVRCAIKIAFVYSRAKRIVIEEFVEGTRHGISTFIQDGKVVFYFYDDEHYFKNPYLVSGASAPGGVGANNLLQLIETIESIASTLKMVSGIVHVQFIVNQDGVPIIIEICRRPPGDLYTRFVQHATGIDYPSYIVKAAAGMDCSELRQVDVDGFFTRHCIMSSEPGSVLGVTYDKKIERNIIEEFLWWKEGDLITDIYTHKLGIVFLRFNSKEEMCSLSNNLQQLIHTDVIALST